MPKKIKKSSKSTARVKMSELLKEYAEPLLKEATDLNSVRIAIAVSSLCWNIASVPEDEQGDLMREALAKLSEVSGDYETSKNIMEMMISRKKMFFSEYNNLIVDQEVVPLNNGGYYLTVFSTDYNPDSSP